MGDKIYFVLAGTGIRIGEEERVVKAGDPVCAPPVEEHGVKNLGPRRLALFVVKAPQLS